jgi:GAF domain-containing protein
VRSQVLVPIVRDERLVAFVSVHDANRIRHWSEEEVAAAERAAERIGRDL